MFRVMTCCRLVVSHIADTRNSHVGWGVATTQHLTTCCQHGEYITKEESTAIIKSIKLMKGLKMFGLIFTCGEEG